MYFINKKASLLSMLLALVLVAQAPIISFAAQVEDNIDEVVEEVSRGDTMDLNAGTILENKGTVNDNAGLIDNNKGQVGDNLGDISQNNGNVEDNSGYIHESNGSVKSNSGMVSTNFGDIEENSGTVPLNEGYVYQNTGDIYMNNGELGINDGRVDENDGVIEENRGTVYNNIDTIETNSDTVIHNEGVIDENRGIVGDNSGVIELNSNEVNNNLGAIKENENTVYVNEGTVEKNKGYIAQNTGTVKENHGEVDNQVKYEDLGDVAAEYETATNGIVEKNYGTVYNSGVVKVNKGKVFNNGGIIEDDQGEHYFRVWFSLPSTLPDAAWSYKVDKGFVSYRDFDRWLEKNSVGQMTFKLNKGYGWEYDFGAPGDKDGYRGKVNNDGSFTIIVDRMHEWLMNVALIIPLKEIGSNNTSGAKKVAAKTEAYVERRTIKYDLDGGAFNKGTEDEETGIVERVYVKDEEITFTEIPEKDGYVFKCWEEVLPEDEELTEDEKVNEAGEVVEDEEEKVEPRRFEKDDTFIVEEDITFKAIWEKENA